MISKNKKNILLLAATTTSLFVQSTTLIIPREVVKKEVSLFVLVEDQKTLKAGRFELKETELVYKIAPHELHNVEATLDLPGTEVACFDSDTPYLEDGSVIYFEIDPDFTLIKALVVSDNLLDETFIMFKSLDDDTFDFNFDGTFGGDLDEELKGVRAHQNDPVKSFSISQIGAIVHIAALVGVENTKRFFSKLNKRAKSYIRWLAGYDS